MKKFNIFYIFILFCVFSCLEDINMPGGRINTSLPILKVNEAGEITYNSIMVNAVIESANGYEITSRGFIYGLNSNLRNDGNNISVPLEGDGIGNFSYKINNLKANTKYYYIAYAVNAKGIQYSDVFDFTTWSETPTVRTENALDVMDGNITFSGSIISSGATPIEKCGICWSINSENPVYNVDNTYIHSSVEEHFYTELHKMTGGKIYYFRAFAINSYGISYGETISLPTPLIWEELQPFPDEGRILPTTFTIFQNFYVVAGDANNSIPQNSLYEYNLISDTWQKKADYPGVTRKAPSSFVLGNRAFVGLGIPGSGGGVLSDFNFYMQNHNQWYEIDTKFPSNEARGYALSFSINDIGYIVGGQIFNYPRYETLKDVWTYELVDGVGVWDKKKDFPVSTMIGIAFSFNNRAFVGLGMSLSPIKYYNQIWEYNHIDDSWEVITTVPNDFDLAEGGITTVTIVEEKAYIIDGINQVWIFDLNTKEWEKKSIMPGEISPNQCMFSKQHDIYVGLKRNSSVFYKYRPFWDNPVTP